MKRSDLRHITISDALALTVPLLLIVPNIILDLSQPMTLWAATVNVVLPLGIYSCLYALWRRGPLLTLLLIPMMVFSAFQIVISYLYGNGIIGVDMFLNVVTTNVAEVNELLGNLLIAIGAILLLYLPPIIAAIAGLSRKSLTSERLMLRIRNIAIPVTVCMAVAMFSSLNFYSPLDDLFPANIFKNLGMAIGRQAKVNSYPQTSAGYTYHAESARPDSLREVYVVVIGETSRADRWQLAGYERATNPRLSARDGLIFFPKTLTESNTTHKSVPMILSDLTAANFDSIDYRKSMLTAFNEAGYSTTFISNQKRNRSYTEYFAKEADRTLYLPDGAASQPYDEEVIPALEEILADSTAGKQFIVIHTYGSHFKYNDRYPRSHAVFTPDIFADANPGCRDELNNAFDNTVTYTDYVLSQIIERLDSLNVPSALIYTSDHGEDIYDDSRLRFLHASPTPTYYQLHVPMLVWLSDESQELMPGAMEAMKRNSLGRTCSTEAVFHTIIDLAGLRTPLCESRSALTRGDYRAPEPIFIDDRNEMHPLTESGLTDDDMVILKRKEIL